MPVIGDTKIIAPFSVVYVALSFILCTIYSQAEISLPSFGNRTYVSKEAVVNATWTYNFGNARISYVQWSFSNKVRPSQPSDFQVLADTFGGKINEGKNRSLIRNLNFTLPSTLVINNVQLDDNGTYRFTVFVVNVNPAPISDISVIVLVQPTAAVSCPSNNEIKEGENFSCFCNGTTGNPPPTATWTKNGVGIIGSGYLTNELLLENVSKNMSGNYNCTVQSYNLTDSKVIKLLVKSQPTAKTNCSANIIVSEGEGIFCRCWAKGGNPPPNASWFNSADESLKSKMLSLELVTRQDRGKYCCKVNSLDLDDEECVQVFVKFPPNITSFTSSEPNNSAHVGSTINITCIAEGYPAVNYIITHNNQTVRDVIDGKHTIRNVTYNVSGTYGCIANNSLGKDTATFYLNVTAETPRPTLTQSTPTLATRTPKPIASEPISPAVIAVIVLACLVFLILVVVTTHCWLIPLIKRRKREKEGRLGEEESMNSPGGNTLDGNAAKPENPYELADEGNENGGADSDRPSTSATDKSTTPAAEPGLPPVYAVVDKSKMSAKEKKPVDPSQLTYASLDPVALQPDSSKMRPRPKEESNYASIDLDKL